MLTGHARFEMQRRGVREDEVAEVLTAPEQRERIGEARWVFQSRFSRGNPSKVFLLRVFLDVDRDPPEVVTAYWTSKVDKYWE